jgi:hypothetical protein
VSEHTGGNAIVYPIKSRREFALWAHARLCFRNCADACDLALSPELNIRDIRYKSLSVFAVVEYAKPFMRSEGLGRLDETMIKLDPDDKTLHDFVVRFRNKIVVHLDTQGEADKPALADYQHHPHCVRLELTEGEGINCIVEETRLEREYLVALRLLARECAKKARYHEKGHVKKLLQVAKRAGEKLNVGEYLLELDNPDRALRKLSAEEKAENFWPEGQN